MCDFYHRDHNSALTPQRTSRRLPSAPPVQKGARVTGVGEKWQIESERGGGRGKSVGRTADSG